MKNQQKEQCSGSMGIWIMGILIFPVMVIGVIPLCILWSYGNFRISTYLPLPWNLLVTAIALLLLMAGFLLSLKSCLLFQRVGRGTPVPWFPPEHLVVRGVYRRTRNPMLSGISIMILGEVLFFISFGLLIYLAVFLTGTFICIAFKEEPTLQKRFGDEYTLYKQNVPRWIPSLTPWVPPWDDTSSYES